MSSSPRKNRRASCPAPRDVPTLGNAVQFSEDRVNLPRIAALKNADSPNNRSPTASTSYTKGTLPSLHHQPSAPLPAEHSFSTPHRGPHPGARATARRASVDTSALIREYRTTGTVPNSYSNTHASSAAQSAATTTGVSASVGSVTARTGRRSSIDSYRSQIAATQAVAAHELKWQGESPKRFCILRGSVVVGEKDVQSLYSMYAEVINLGQGDFTTDAVKTYLRTLEANLAPNNPQVKLANAVSGALVARSWELIQKGRHLGFTDLLQTVYPRASRDEIQFLADSPQELMRAAKTSSSGDLGYTLSIEESGKAAEILKLSPKNDMGYVDLKSLVAKIVLTFSKLDEPTVWRQLTQAGVPRHHKAIDLEGFQKFLAVNLSSKTPVDLDQWLAVLMGYDVVLGSAVRGGAVSSKDVAEEIQGYKKPGGETSRFSKFLGAIGVGHKKV